MYDEWKLWNIKKPYVTSSASKLTCRLRRYLEPFLDSRNGTVEIRVTRRKYTSKHTVEKHISLFIGESLQRRAPYAPDAAGCFVGDR